MPKLWRNKNAYILHGCAKRGHLVVFTKITNVFTSVSAILSIILLRIYPTNTLVPYKILYANCCIVRNSKKLETSVDVVCTNTHTQIMKWHAAVNKNKEASNIVK